MIAPRIKAPERVTFVTRRSRFRGLQPLRGQDAFATAVGMLALQVQNSLGSFSSSMIMSLNSLDSKISPHSLHSTNSESSSRATIWTRGCLQGALSVFFSGSGDDGDGVINPGSSFPGIRQRDFAGNWR